MGAEYKLSIELINKIFNYLGVKPYIEVALLIQEMEKEMQRQDAAQIEQKKSE